MRIIYFAIILFSQVLTQANSSDAFLDSSPVVGDAIALGNESHLLFTTNFNVDLIIDKFKASDISTLEIDSFEGNRNKIILNVGNSLLGKTNFNYGFSNESAK